MDNQNPINEIEGLWDKSDYKDYFDFINFRIDNYWLDEKLEEFYPGNLYKGLIPTLAFWLDSALTLISNWLSPTKVAAFATPRYWALKLMF